MKAAHVRIASYIYISLQNANVCNECILVYQLKRCRSDLLRADEHYILRSTNFSLQFFISM